MTTTEVEVEVTEQQSVNICDGCGLEVEAGVTYEAKGTEYPDLHYHIGECLENATIGDGYEQLSWSDLEHGNSSSKVVMVQTRVTAVMAILGSVTILTGVYYRTLTAVIVGVIILTFALVAARSYALQPTNALREVSND